MKRYLFVIVSYCLIGLNTAQAQYVEWADLAVSGPSYSNAVATDANGNAYMTGHYYSDITFDGTTHFGTGFFLVKYDPSGQPLWSTVGTGAPNSKGTGVAVDAAGNVFVTGVFRQPVTLGTGANTVTLNNTNASSPYYQEMFVAKYDSNGNLIWAKKAGGASEDEALRLVLDNAGDCYIMGTYTDNADFDGITITGLGNGIHSFLAKYNNTTGDVMWANNQPENFTNHFIDMDTDGTDIHMIGQYSFAYRKVAGSDGTTLADQQTNGSPESQSAFAVDAANNRYVISNRIVYNQ